MEKILVAEDDADADEGVDLDVDEDLDGLDDVTDNDDNATSEPATLNLKPIPRLVNNSLNKGTTTNNISLGIDILGDVVDDVGELIVHGAILKLLYQIDPKWFY